MSILNKNTMAQLVFSTAKPIKRKRMRIGERHREEIRKFRQTIPKGEIAFMVLKRM